MPVLPIYVDIDGTLTDVPKAKWGSVHPARIQYIQKLITDGVEVYLWSGGGAKYVRDFAKRYDLFPAACLGKPDWLVDDNENIRPGGLRRVAPDEFFKLADTSTSRPPTERN